MSMLTLGDLAQSYAHRRANTRMTSELTRLGTELTTGLKTDKRLAGTGDSGPLSSIERSLTRLKGFDTATTEAKLFSQSTQDVLERLSKQLGSVSSDVQQLATDPNSADAAAKRARGAFEASVSTLNTSVSGRTLLAGVQSSGPAMADADTMMNALRTQIDGITDPAAVSRAIDDWFGEGGGFDTVGYLGGEPRATTRLSPDDDLRIDATGDDPAIRSSLASLAKAALAAEGASDLAPQDRVELLRDAAGGTADSRSALIGLQTRIGAAQERVEIATARNESEKASLESARLALISADPYETVSRMEQVQAQLESLYTITARMSRLSLTNYL